MPLHLLESQNQMYFPIWVFNDNSKNMKNNSKTKTRYKQGKPSQKLANPENTQKKIKTDSTKDYLKFTPSAKP